jgi:D-lyxose ketol-isomerase
MRRTQINELMEEATGFFAAQGFMLPPWAFRAPGDWRGRYATDSEIVDNMLGWDLTDFGSGDFVRRGLLLFTVRNGNPKKDRKSYAEKAMIVQEGQVTPLHFHWSKMEDIIVRAGGRLVVELYGSTREEGLSKERVRVRVDGVLREVEAGGSLVLGLGESVCLLPGMYHRFFGEAGSGPVLVGEVSAVNDDLSDNRFYEQVGRFPQIDEDAEPLHLLVSDYRKYL